jgi:hypothetical protein
MARVGLSGNEAEHMVLATVPVVRSAVVVHAHARQPGHSFPERLQGLRSQGTHKTAFQPHA